VVIASIFHDIIVEIYMKTIIFTAAAAKDLDALPAEAREQVVEALSRFAIDGTGDVRKLAGREGFRLRVGGYRVLFTQDLTTILAIYIGRRQTTTYSKG
jgi:mRNA interferase RelE/StbE